MLTVLADLISCRLFGLPRLWAFDLYQRVQPAHRDLSAIVIIDIDEESVRRVGRWPWPRDRLAAVVNAAAEARVIGLDILLSESDRTTAGDLDATLAAAVARAPVILAAAEDPRVPDDSRRLLSAPPVFQVGGDPHHSLPRTAGVIWPLPIFAGAAHGIGLAVVTPGPDGVLRRLPSLFTAGATLLPSFALDVIRVATGSPGIRARADDHAMLGIEVGGRVTATDYTGAIWPRFADGPPARVVPAWRVLSGDLSRDAFRGRIVLVGSSLAGLGDVNMSPLGELQTGTAFNAQVISSLLAGDTLWRPSWAVALELIIAVVLGSVSLFLFARVTDQVYVALAIGIPVTLMLTCFGAYGTDGFLFDWTLPVLGLAATNAAALVVRAHEEKRGRLVREAQITAALHDIDKARRVITRALNSAKLATLGEIALVLAHELQQPIATMSLAAENAEAALEDGNVDIPDARRRLERIVDQAKRARNIIDQLRVFGRSDAGTAKPFDLATTVNDALLLVDPLLRASGISLVTVCPTDLPRIIGQKILMEQVIVNLCVNACDALAANPATDRQVEVAASRFGDSVRLIVSDNGPGIPKEVVPHVFEPFFTTKPAGDGTGLGLSISQRIVESIGGCMTAGNRHSGGAEIVVTLPAAPPVNAET
jgi:signal transduction histidine kinase